MNEPTPAGGPARPRDAFDLACRYLTAREKCAAQVRDYLRRKGFTDEEIASAVALLVGRRLVDDLRYARLYAESRSRRSPRSGAYLIRELITRGVDGETARLAVAEFLKDVPEEELARRILAKLPAGGPDATQRAARRLVARGFKASLALRTERLREEPGGPGGEDDGGVGGED